MTKIPAGLRGCIDRYEAAVLDAAFAGSYHPDDAEQVRDEMQRRRKLLEDAIARNMEKGAKP